MTLPLGRGIVQCSALEVLGAEHLYIDVLVARKRRLRTNTAACPLMRAEGATTMQKRLCVLVIIAVVLAGLWLGGAIRDAQDRQELAVANSAPQLTDEEVLAANALNERAMRQDHLPSW